MIKVLFCLRGQSAASRCEKRTGAGKEKTLSPLTSLADGLRQAEKLEGRRRLILLDIARSGGLDTRSSHAIVSHAENGAIRTARIDTCLRRIEPRCPHAESRAGRLPFPLDMPIPKTEPGQVNFMLGMARRCQIVYRLLRLLAWKAGERRTCEICSEMARQEKTFILFLGAMQADPARLTRRRGGLH